MDDLAGQYIARIMSMLHIAPAGSARGAGDPSEIAGDLFTILTSREFCYLGRTKTAPYREHTVATMAGDIARGEPVHFYYDLGAGYHASIEPDGTGLVFGVGFSELCALAQIASFSGAVADVYPPGATFVLVIDNICGLLTNDIPIEKSAAYCAELRALIEQTGLGDHVSVLVESEQFTLAQYEIDRARLAAEAAGMNPTPLDVENVIRFLGRPCDVAEAAERMARYRQAGELTERMLEGVVRGVRMTQRATGATLGFRPFPGGDSRTQVGELALSPTSKGTVRPVLLTSRNVHRFRLTRMEFPRLLPAAVKSVTYAEPVEVARGSG